MGWIVAFGLAAVVFVWMRRRKREERRADPPGGAVAPWEYRELEKLEDRTLWKLQRSRGIERYDAVRAVFGDRADEVWQRGLTTKEVVEVVVWLRAQPKVTDAARG